LNASGRICTIPVAKITPAAKDFTMKKTSFSGLSTRTDRPRIGIITPIAPAHRMEAMEMSFNSRACCASLRSVVLMQSQEQRAWRGRRERNRARERRVGFVPLMAKREREREREQMQMQIEAV
jgi:hypothetical protein